MEKLYKLVLIFGLPFVSCESDPCMTGNYEVLNDWERSVNNAHGSLCDFSLSNGWYRPISLVGNTMPTECPVNGFRCGTSVPIWMNGSYPLLGETTDVVACASHYNSDCCVDAYDIQVKNCGEYYVYNLKKTVGCRQAYCFGTEVKCAVGETSDNGGFTPGCEFDPCHPINYKVLNGEVKRSSNYTLQPDDNAIEDSRLITGWYKIDSATGNDIVNESVSMGQCGTLYPVWMLGNIPEVSDKTADRTMCRSNLTNTCGEKIDMQIRNCGSFRTYYLQQLNVDKSAYCFGTLPVPEPTTIQFTTTTESHRHTRPKKETMSVTIVIVCIVPPCLVILAIVIFKIIKSKTVAKRAVSFSDFQEKKTNQPPSYDETMQNDKNELRHEYNKIQPNIKQEMGGRPMEVWSSGNKFAEIHNN